MLPITSKVLIQNSVSSPLGGISLAGVARNGLGVPVANRILNRYSLVYVFDGEGTYTDETHANLPITPGSVIQVLPNTKHWYGPKGSRGWHEVYIIFEGPIFDVWQDRGCFELESQVVSLSPIDYWRDRFLAAIDVPDGHDELGAMSDVIRVQSLIIDIHKALQEGGEDDADWLHQAQQALAQTKNARSAARELGISYESFRKRFRRLYGTPPTRYHAILMMERACDLLSNSSHTVKEIARQLDYCDEFHFSKRFSHIIGCSPSTYRARTNNG